MPGIAYNEFCNNKECGHPLEAHIPRRRAGEEITAEQISVAEEGFFGCDFSDPADITHAVCGCLKFVVAQPVEAQPIAPPGYRGPDTTDYEVRRVTISDANDANISTVLVLWWSGRVTWTTPDVPF